MNKILIELNKNSLIISLKQKRTLPDKLMDTNIISHDKLAFSDEYIYNNQKIVSLFINDLVIEKNINHILIKESELLDLAFLILLFDFNR